ncbi:MAG: hypothetical protein PHD32_03190 [Eubacteriales bacterium]|nr:hypothetical protein [Eubacteriales bacterium]
MNKKRDGRRGAALLNVMLAMVILSILGLSILSVTTVNAQRAAKLKDYEGEYYDAEAAVNAAVDALRRAAVEKYDVWVTAANASPASRPDQTTTDEQFFAQIAQAARDMLDSRYAALVTITPPTAYTALAQGTEGVYTVTATTDTTLGGRTAQATLAVRRLPLSTVGGGGFGSCAIVMGQGGADNLSGSFYVESGDVVLGSDAGMTISRQARTNYATAGIGDYIAQDNSGSMSVTDLSGGLWKRGIVSYIQQYGASLPGFAVISGNRGRQKAIIENPANTILFYDGDFTVDTGYKMGGKMLFVTGDVTVKGVPANQNNTAGLMIFAGGDIFYDTDAEKNGPGNYVFLYCEGDLEITGAKTDAHMIAFAQEDITLEQDHKGEYGVNGQLLCGETLENDTDHVMNVNFDETSSKAAEAFYARIAALPGDAPKPNSQTLGGGAGGRVTLPLGEFLGQRSGVTEK